VSRQQRETIRCDGPGGIGSANRIAPNPNQDIVKIFRPRPPAMTAVAAFLLAFPALFSIINPIGGALIFNEVTLGFPTPTKLRVAGRVGLYSLVVLLGALWGGAYVLNFFGITLAALRIGGGTVVALTAWHLLMAQDHHENRQRPETEAAIGETLDVAFFPLTMPLTTGPGAISVAITLGAERPGTGLGVLAFFLGASAAACANALIVWVAYRSAGRVTDWLSATARNILARLMAFLLLCIGVQILITGVGEAVSGWQMR
jgi:multiple antibiotic resistance protein